MHRDRESIMIFDMVFEEEIEKAANTHTQLP